VKGNSKEKGNLKRGCSSPGLGNERWAQEGGVSDGTHAVRKKKKNKKKGDILPGPATAKGKGEKG